MTKTNNLILLRNFFYFNQSYYSGNGNLNIYTNMEYEESTLIISARYATITQYCASSYILITIIIHQLI